MERNPPAHCCGQFLLSWDTSISDIVNEMQASMGLMMLAGSVDPDLLQVASALMCLRMHAESKLAGIIKGAGVASAESLVSPPCNLLRDCSVVLSRLDYEAIQSSVR